MAEELTNSERIVMVPDYTDGGLVNTPPSPSMKMVPSRVGRPREKDVGAIDGGNGIVRYAASDGTLHTETPRAARAFNDYLEMGSSRSLKRLAELYVEGDPEWTNNYASVLRQLEDYSSNYDWQNRIRTLLATESTKAISAARREANKSARERIRRAQKIQVVAEAIIDAAMSIDEVPLSAEEARQLLKPAITMMQVGLAAERAEIGATMDKIVPPIPIEAMTDEQLDDYIAGLHEL